MARNRPLILRQGERTRISNSILQDRIGSRRALAASLCFMPIGVSARRDHVGFIGGVAAVAAAGQTRALAKTGDGLLPTRTLGRTGATPSILAMGCGSRLSMYEQEDKAVEALNLALDLGVTYLDTAQSYGGGNSEIWVGKVMAHRRNEVFLATKIAFRDYDQAMRRTEDSLKRLQTDQIDLVHIHSLKGEDDLAVIEAGSLKALMELREQKVCRFAGITSHSYPDVLAKALERHDFDCTQMALNAAKQGRSENAQTPVDHMPEDSFEAVALPVAVRKKMGVLVMKATGQEALVGDGPEQGRDRTPAAIRAVSARHLSCRWHADTRVSQGKRYRRQELPADGTRRNGPVLQGIVHCKQTCDGSFAGGGPGSSRWSRRSGLQAARVVHHMCGRRQGRRRA